MNDATNPGEVRLAFPAMSVISGSSAWIVDDPALLRLNNAHAEELSVLSAERLRDLLGMAFLACQVGEAEALLIAFDQGVAYDSPNFLWFRERLPRFVYVDRVVVAPSARGRGLAAELYRFVFRQAREQGHEHVVCEVNADPPNPASDAFHARMGFRVIGSAVLTGSDKTVRYFSRALTDADLDDAKLS